MKRTLSLLVMGAMTLQRMVAERAESIRDFDFTGAKTKPGCVAVSAGTKYSDTNGFGFELGASLMPGSNCITSDKSFLF